MSLHDDVIALREDEGLSWVEMGKQLDMHPEAARSLYRRLKTKEKQDGPKIDSDDLDDVFEEDDEISEEVASIFFRDKKVAEQLDWRELADYAKMGASIMNRMDAYQRTATVEIKTDTPIALVNTGDWHLGDPSIDYSEWTDDMEYIIDTPYMYMVEVGDTIQNMRNFKTLSAVFAQVLTPPQQASMMKSVVDELTEKKKMVAKVTGNHDVEFDERIFGEALEKYLLTKMEAPRFRNRGLLKLKVGEVTYTILMFHKSRFRSFMRTTHGNYREYQLSYPADIVVGAHDHVPGFETMWHYNLAREAGMNFGGESYLIKVGTYQDSDYGWKYFHNGGSLNPTVVLFPDRHKKLAFMDPRDAGKYIETFL